MITKIGDLLSVTKGTIVHQVNAQGVMGSGVALSIREKYPQVWTDYTCTVGPAYTQSRKGFDLLGQAIFSKVSPDLCIVSTVSQQFFGKASKRYTSYDALDRAFSTIKQNVDDGTISPDIHVPLIGCDRGGANWNVVQSIIEQYFPEFTLWVLPA